MTINATRVDFSIYVFRESEIDGVGKFEWDSCKRIKEIITKLYRAQEMF